MVEMLEGFSQLGLTKAKSLGTLLGSSTCRPSPRETGLVTVHSIGKNPLALEVMEEGWGYLSRLRGFVRRAMLALWLAVPCGLRFDVGEHPDSDR